MSNYAANIEALFERTENYSKTTQELLKLKIIEKSSDFISTFISQIVVAIFAVFFVLSINMGAAIWIGEELGKIYYGFFIVGLFDVIICGALYVFRDKWIKSHINNTIIRQMLKG